MQPIQLAKWFAATALLGTLVATLEVARRMTYYSDGSLVLSPLHWLALPILCAVTLVFTVTKRSVAAIWTPIGAFGAFVVASLFSFGPFLLIALPLLVTAGALHAAAGVNRRQLASIPVWLLLGASGLGALFFAIHEVQARLDGGRNIEAPAMIVSAWVFASTACAITTWWVVTKTVTQTRASTN